MSTRLTDSITATNKSILELYSKIKDGTLILRPRFQRKLVWKKTHKINFIKTILDNYPFPEVYIATGRIDSTTMTNEEIVVDGQQRLSTIRDYIDGIGDFQNQKQIPSYSDLNTNDRDNFATYKVIVRDLGKLEEDIVNDIFQRINSTEYSLKTMEKKNASYIDNAFMDFCKKLLESEEENSEYGVISQFFIEKEIFTSNDLRRMLDLQYIMLIVISLEIGYFNRTTEIDNYLDENQDDYPNKDYILDMLHNIIQFINLLELNKKSYWLNKANIFTLIIELSKFNLDDLDIELIKNKLVLLENLYKIGDTKDQEFEKYKEVAKEAVNDKKSRIFRGEFIKKFLTECLKAKTLF